MSVGPRTTLQRDKQQALMPWALQPVSACVCARAGACGTVLRSTGGAWAMVLWAPLVVDRAAAEGFGATVTGTGFQLVLQTLWPSHVVSTRSQAALWAQVAMGSRSSSPGRGCGRWTPDHAVAWEQQLPMPVLQSPTLHRMQ